VKRILIVAAVLLVLLVAAWLALGATVISNTPTLTYTLPTGEVISGSGAPVRIVALARIPTSAVSPGLVWPGGEVTVTHVIEGVGAPVTWATPLNGVTYVAGSTKLDGVTKPDPTIAGGKATWGPYTIADATEATLTYKLKAQ
jgi:hypothetical protein